MPLVKILDNVIPLPYAVCMTKREAKKRAWFAAYQHLDGLLGAGWPYEIVDNAAPNESDADLERMHTAMREIVDHCFDRSQ
jgi:hypothetical protein